MKVLVTGGAGYIGSHTCIELLNANHDIVVIDNFSNSSPESLVRVEKITNKTLDLYHFDIKDEILLYEVFEQHSIDAVIHFAGFKAVNESVQQPIEYYTNNLSGTLTLLSVMKKFEVNNLVFSSSATVYGDPHTLPITETFPLSATNPYGRSKLIIEEICRDICLSNIDWNITLLRYFNPVGAHHSGIIGENPNGTPNNLMPYISQVAVGKQKKLSIFGGDYETPDGTGIRDYIHVVDLALGHLCALKKLSSNSGLTTYNLGTGNGYSVLEVVSAFELASGKVVPYEITAKRAGDVAMCYADPSLALKELNWKATRDLTSMVEDTWRWQNNNPSGY